VSKELKLLIVSLLLILGSIVFFWWQNQGCYQIEYQDLTGSHTTTVCEQAGE